MEMLEFGSMPYERPDMDGAKRAYEAAIALLKNAKSYEEARGAFFDLQEKEKPLGTMMSLCSVRNTIDTTDAYYDAEMKWLRAENARLIPLRKQYQQALLTSAARYGLAAGGGVIGQLSASQLGAIGEAIASSKFSQKQETAADDYGYDFLKNAGKNPWALAMAFEKLETLSSGTNSGGSNAATSQAASSLFSTHPATADRIQRIAERATADGFKHP